MTLLKVEDRNSQQNSMFYPECKNSDFSDREMEDSCKSSTSPAPISPGEEVYNLHQYGSVENFVAAQIESGEQQGSFLVTNLSSVIGQMEQWKHELPMVDPFYAVKCLPDPVVLKVLASMGCNFDCATMTEIDLVVNNLGEQSVSHRGSTSTSIVYSNPAKMESHLNFAIQNNVRMTVFDGEDELYKIAVLEGHENLQLLLRLATDDAASICQFSTKYGCPVDEAPYLLEVAQSLGLNVAGVAFHVGSGCGDAVAYTTALAHTQRVFDAAEKLGMSPLHVVDIGGGFPGEQHGYGGPGMPTFQDLAKVIRIGIQQFLANLAEGSPCGNGTRDINRIRFIAEPGRYFVAASTTIATKVFSRKGGRQNKQQALYVDDGVYGSFNNVVYDHATPVPEKLYLGASRSCRNLPSLAKGPILPMSGLSSSSSASATLNSMSTKASVIQETTNVLAGSAKPPAPPVQLKSSLTMSKEMSCDQPVKRESRSLSTCSEEIKDSEETKDGNGLEAMHGAPEPYDTPAEEALIPSFVFGPTCDGLDQMCDISTTRLPRCEVGEWLVWPNNGAYTHTASYTFNGFTHVPKRTYCSF